jgi:hypothetical protein
MLDRNEKWDTVSVAVITSRPFIELDAIERDTIPPALESITVLDSVTLRVTFDKPLDPLIPLQPALVRMQHADSSAIEVTRVQWQSQYDRQKAVLDSARKADSIKALPPPAKTDTGAPPPPVPTPPPTPAPTRPAPPPPKPRLPPPDRGIVITIAPPAAFTPTQTYRVTVLGMRNLVGKSHEASRSFTVPKPPPPKIVTDTTKKTPPVRPPTTPPVKPPRSTR